MIKIQDDVNNSPNHLESEQNSPDFKWLVQDQPFGLFVKWSGFWIPDTICNWDPLQTNLCLAIPRDIQIPTVMQFLG